MAFDISTPLFFFRHGETFYNAEGRLQGQLDTPLSPTGRGQAVEAGLKLGAALEANGLAFDRVGWFASPLSRAAQSMALARAALALEQDAFVRDKRLMELSFGLWQNLTWPEVATRCPGGVAARKSDFWNFRPPGGESYADLANRLRAFLDGLTGPGTLDVTPERLAFIARSVAARDRTVPRLVLRRAEKDGGPRRPPPHNSGAGTGSRRRAGTGATERISRTG